MADTHFMGLAGQLHFLGDVAELGYNVSIPSPDEGDDVITSCPTTQRIQRVQVKTSNGRRQRSSHSYQFNVSDSHLAQPGTPERIFVFSMRRSLVFYPLIIPYADLDGLNQRHNFGTFEGKGWVFTVRFNDDNTITAGAGKNLIYLNDYLWNYDAWSRRVTNSKKPSKAATPYNVPW